MAKKTPAKKKAAKKTLNKEAVQSKIRTARNARAQVLPGMETVTDKKMDHWFAAIAEIRRNRALGIEDEVGFSALIHERMKQKGWQSYVSNGLRGDRIKSQGEKLALHIVKDRTERAMSTTRPLDTVDNEPPVTSEELQDAADVSVN